MYCSTCGVAVTKGLSYCNHCGTKLNRDDAAGSSREVRPEMLVASMVGTFVFGMIALAIMMGVMKNVVGLPEAHVLAFALTAFLLMLILEGVFIRLLLRRRRDEEQRQPALSTNNATNELGAGQPGELPEARASVTEHTTRAFEPVRRDRK